ncbi:MAG: FAD-binding oxidoreductase [Nocardia sp.]|nr:FAD-binding oxidoreductase [Nocardia sp.]
MTKPSDGRSWWGWGTEAGALSTAECDELLTRTTTLLPDHDFTDHAPPDPRSLPVPAPRIRVPDTLAALVSDDQVDRLAHARGKAYRDIVRNLAGDVGHVPDLVARPRDERDVVSLLDFCTTSDIALIPYGGGSSVVGGVEPRFDGPSISLDLAALDRVQEIDPVSRTARIQGGVYGPDLESQLRPSGFTLRHFPQSFEFSTLGGWLATRSGGHFATLYTHIDDLTESMRVVTGAGISESRRLPGSGAGPSPDRLFLGSEGTLGIITEAWMRLQSRPTYGATASITFTDYERAVAATRAIAQAGLYPSNCRLLDGGEALINAGKMTAGLLIVAFESADHPIDAWMQRAVAIAADHGGTVESMRNRDDAADDSSGAWKSSFIRMPYQRDALVRRSMLAETFETAITWDRFAQFHAAVTTAANDAIARVCGSGRGVVTCRFTHVYPDGPAPYYGIYAGGRRGSLLAQWDDIKAAVSEAIAAAGGTITHHHAVGRDHRPWYDRQRPEPFADALRATKTALDPAGILNPGVLLDP